MQKIEFKWEFPLSGKMLLEMIISKWVTDLNKYIEFWNTTELWIIWMRSPALEIVWENADKVFELLKEVWEPYVDDFETMVEEPKFND